MTLLTGSVLCWTRMGTARHAKSFFLPWACYSHTSTAYFTQLYNHCRIVAENSGNYVAADGFFGIQILPNSINVQLGLLGELTMLPRHLVKWRGDTPSHSPSNRCCSIKAQTEGKEHRVANCPGFTWTVHKLAHSVQC